jgi:uncharacterized protein (UPF0276 family)
MDSTPISWPSTKPAPTSVGVGLKPVHYREILETAPAIDWFEVHPENYMFDGGPSHAWLREIRQKYPLSLHSVGTSLGSVQPVDATHLKWLRQLACTYDPFVISDHVSWSMSSVDFLNDLLPLPYTNESLKVLSRNIEQVQRHLGTTILVENPSTYLQFRDAEFTEPAFLSALSDRTNCGLLLDINNVFVCACNHGYDPWDYLTQIPHGSVQEIHLAGHSLTTIGQTEIRIDDHGSSVCDEVWQLYSRYISTYGPSPTLIEWDSNIPPLATLLSEVSKARGLVRDATTTGVGA